MRKELSDGYNLNVLWYHISMYFFDNQRHKMSYIHVKYQNQEAVFSIPDSELIEGELKKNKLRLVQAWIEIHQEERMEN